MTERWLPVVGFEGSYQVSDRGRVRSIDRIYNVVDPSPRYLKRVYRRIWRGRILFQWQHYSRGKPAYLQVRLCAKDVGKTIYVHAIVAAAFIGRRPKGKMVNHKDMCKTNNAASNLEYLTNAENLHHARAHGVISGPRRH